MLSHDKDHGALLETRTNMAPHLLPTAAILAGYAVISLPAVFAAWTSEATWHSDGILQGVVLCVVLSVLSAIDIKTLRLPDLLTLPLAALGLLLALAKLPVSEALLYGAAALTGYGTIWLTRWSYERLRGTQGLGLGDAKLFAAAGAWVGFDGLASVLLYACVGGLVYTAILRLCGRAIGLHDAIAFGPFLALGLWIVWLYGPLV